MTEPRSVADKRPWKYDDDGSGDGVPEAVENDPKRLKLLPSSSSQNSRKTLDVQKWKLLPAIVYELLALIKKSEKPDQPDGLDAQQQKSREDIKEEINNLPNPNYQTKTINIEIKNENLKESYDIEGIYDENPNIKLLNPEESNKLITLKSSVEDSVQNLELNLPASKIEIVGIQKEISLNTSISVIDTEKKVDNKKNETNEKADINKMSSLVENISNDCVGNNISKTENLISLSKKEQLFNLLNNLCLNGLSKIPTTKPCPCSCKYCLYVSNIPKNQFPVNNLFTSINYSNLTSCHISNQLAPSDLCVSKISIPDGPICTKNDSYNEDNSNLKYIENNETRVVETSKNVWVNDLVSLIKKNEMSKE